MLVEAIKAMLSDKCNGKIGFKWALRCSFDGRLTRDFLGMNMNALLDDIVVVVVLIKVHLAKTKNKKQFCLVIYTIM